MRYMVVRRQTTAPATQVPSWVDDAINAGWVIGTWARISGAAPTHGLSATNTLHNIWANVGGTPENDPGSDAIVHAWAGAIFASGYGLYGTYCIWNGGHNNSYDNTMYACSMADRTWFRATVAYPTPTFPGGTDVDGMWPPNDIQVNGSPSVVHTYDLVGYSPPLNSFITLRTQTDNDGNHNTSQRVMLPFATNVWVKKSRSAFSLGSGGWSFYDSARAKFVYRGGGGVGTSTSPRTIQYDPATDLEVAFNPSSAADIAQGDSVAAYSPDDDMGCVIRGGGAPNTVVGIDAGSLGTTRVVLTTSGTDPSGEAAGFEWSTIKQAFIRYPTNGAGVYQFKKSGVGTWQSSTWAWTALLNSGLNTVTPEDMDANGVYSKFQIVEYGTVSMGVVLKNSGESGDGALYAFRIS